jgi:hypothetical protein
MILRTLARMARDPNAEARGDIAMLADEWANKLESEEKTRENSDTSVLRSD